MKLPVFVAAALIENEKGELLISQRLPGSHNGMRWEFPGGKIDYGESPKETLIREIKEELNLDIEVGKMVEHSSVMYGEKHVIVLGFHAKPLSANIEKREVHDFKWVHPKELDTFDMTESAHILIKTFIANR